MSGCEHEWNENNFLVEENRKATVCYKWFEERRVLTPEIEIEELCK